MDEQKGPNHGKETLRLGKRPGDFDRRNLNPADADRTSHAPEGARFPDNVIPFKKGDDHGDA